MLAALVSLVVVAPFPAPQGEAGQAFDLPAIGVVGDPRPAAGAFVTELRADGTIWVAGEKVSFDRWGELLREAAKARPGERLAVGAGFVTLSAVDVVFRADARMPTGALIYLISECAHPEVAAPRIFFAARDDDGEGAFAMFLPTDTGAGAPADIPVMTVRLDANTTAPSHPSQLHPAVVAALMEIDKKHRGLAEVVFEGSGRVSLGAFLAAADAVVRAGVRRAGLGIAPSRPQAAAWNLRRDIGAVIRAEKAVAGGISFGGVRLPAEPVALPDAARAEVVGFVRTLPVPVALGMRSEEEEVEPGAGRPDGVFDSGAFNAGVGLGAEHLRFRARGAPRLQFAREHPDRARAIDAGLKWLVEHQDPSGRWTATGGDDVAVTAVALLALVGQGSTMRAGPYRDSIKRAARWLRNSQSPDGCFSAEDPGVLPRHALAALAFIETFDVSQYKLLLRNSQRALDHLVAQRNDDGGWGDGRDGSTTMATGWAALALVAAEHARLDVKVGSREVCAWFENVAVGDTGRCRTDPKGVLSARDGAAHLGKFPPEHGEMATAAALAARVFAVPVADRDAGRVQRMAGVLLARPPMWNVDVGTVDGLYWLCASDALNQLGGEPWEAWSREIDRVVLPQQVKNGADAGSWDPESVWGELGGRTWTTAVMVLNLQAPYRYMRRR